MVWTPEEAFTFCKLADTPARARSWAKIANAIFEACGDESKAKRIASQAIFHKINRLTKARARKNRDTLMKPFQGRLL